MSSAADQDYHPIGSQSALSVAEQDSYADISEWSQEPQADQRRPCASEWRQAIDSAGRDELKTLVSNMVDTLENGLRSGTTERQAYYNWPPGTGLTGRAKK